jgi:hypothetical protein
MKEKTYYRKLRQAKRYNIDPIKWISMSPEGRKLIKQQYQLRKTIERQERHQRIFDISLLYEKELL